MDWLWWLQIGADALLVLVVAILIFRLKGVGKNSDLPQGEDWEQFIREASELGREFDRLLNEKRKLVKNVLNGLDERIAHLEALKTDFDRQAKDAPAGPNPSMDRVPGEPEAVRKSEPEPVAEPGPGPALSASKLSPEAMDEFRATVLELAQQGQDAAKIAKGTGRPRGEVELILNLNNQDV